MPLEIPEGVLMEDAEANVEKLTKLKELGIHIVIDDFGTAFSSLSYLKNFPLNFLKVDRSLIVKLGRRRAGGQGHSKGDDQPRLCPRLGGHCPRG